MAKKKDTEVPADGEEAAGGGKKKLIIIALVALLAVGGGAYFFLFAGSAEAEEPVAGSVLALDPVTVNLAGSGYLKVGVSLQLTEDAVAGGEEGGVDGAKASDLIVATFSQAQRSDVDTAREALKEALKEKVVEAYKDEDGAEMVMDIYLTEYVAQ